MSKYRITIDVEIESPCSDMVEFTQKTANAILKEAHTSHLNRVTEWMISDLHIRNPAAAEQAIAYHKNWADILDRAEFKLEKIND